MIQRIQTVYLLIAAILVGITLVAPLAWFGADNEMMTLYAFHLTTAEGNVGDMPLWTGILLSLSTALPLIIIFLFKKRMLQFRLCAVEFIFLLGCLVMLGYTYFRMGSGIESGMKPAIILPLVALLFIYLAGRAIFKDEILIRSLNRIR